ncbi:helix-turn-helix domain-containing protein [Bradyrhizobium elkanii]|uniref:Helix-turn-helix domain-containing protein n=1 Tax=Bradyrhizobium elkanii TaxID=29448 RepID=A0A4U6S4T9_BRAEL|nr:hypothetical protein [Bradyrhizobium sp. BR2003]TKV82729.1 helix-turn-helix domain-containing protein [Bradyrhizobium elkanii]
MGRTYKQLSLDDRCEIACLSANGRSVRQIAAALDRSPSTISRELRRNRGSQVGYKPTMPSTRCARGAGRADASNGSPACAARCWNAFAGAGRPSRSLAGWRASTGAR